MTCRVCGRVIRPLDFSRPHWLVARWKDGSGHLEVRCPLHVSRTAVGLVGGADTLKMRFAVRANKLYYGKVWHIKKQGKTILVPPRVLPVDVDEDDRLMKAISRRLK